MKHVYLATAAAATTAAEHAERSQSASSRRPVSRCCCCLYNVQSQPVQPCGITAISIRRRIVATGWLATAAAAAAAAAASMHHSTVAPNYRPIRRQTVENYDSLSQ